MIRTVKNVMKGDFMKNCKGCIEAFNLFSTGIYKVSDKYQDKVGVICLICNDVWRIK